MSIFCMIIIVFFILVLLLTFTIYNFQFGHRINGKQDKWNLKKNVIKKGSFLSKKNVLIGYFYGNKTATDNQDVILFVHGYGVTHKDYGLEINELIKNNHLVFAYDMTGCGESEGRRMKGFGQFIIDAKAAVLYLESLGYAGRIIAISHSTGAFAVAALLRYKKEILKSAIIIDGPSCSTEYVRKSLQKKIPVVPYLMQAYAYLFELIQFGQYANATGLKGIRAFTNPILIMQGEKDVVVPYETSLYAIKDKISQRNVTYIMIPGASHYSTRKEIENTETIEQIAMQAIEKFINR